MFLHKTSCHVRRFFSIPVQRFFFTEIRFYGKINNSELSKIHYNSGIDHLGFPNEKPGDINIQKRNIMEEQTL